MYHSLPRIVFAPTCWLELAVQIRSDVESYTTNSPNWRGGLVPTHTRSQLTAGASGTVRTPPVLSHSSRCRLES